jgi:type VI secretion system protein ImpH
VNLRLRQADVPRLKLGRHARLGYTSWLLGGAAAGDQCQLLLNPADSTGRPRAFARTPAQASPVEPQTSSRD